MVDARWITIVVILFITTNLANLVLLYYLLRERAILARGFAGFDGIGPLERQRRRRGAGVAARARV